MSNNYRKIKKLILVKAFGSKCCICGYDKLISGLDFHHIDEMSKKFGISQSINIKWSTLLKEAKKCILVCCRCHREIHANMHDVSKIKQEIDDEKITDLFKPSGRFSNIKKEKNIKKCLVCGANTYRKYCSIECSAKSQEKIEWDNDKLIDMYVNKKMNVLKISKIYNISYNSVKKRLKKLGVFKQKYGSIV